VVAVAVVRALESKAAKVRQV
jgi:hypothetical protein